MNTLRQPLFREATTALLVALLLLQSATAVAPGPAWWGTQNVTDPAAAPDDFAVANAGQLKHMARKAMLAMDADLPGGAGAAIRALVDPWGTTEETATKPDNGLAINQGQLKHVAAPFYDRLGLPYPWAGATAATDNYALVNLGQLKHVFSFELKFRILGGTSTAVTIPPAVLQAALTQWNALGDEDDKPLGSTADDFDGDGIPNLQEYLMDPTKPLFNPLDIDGDRIDDAVEDDSGGILSKLDFADAVRDHDGDGVMNFEEVLLGLNLNGASTSGRADGLTDAEVLMWGLAAGKPLAQSADALRLFWQQIDAAWITENVGDGHASWVAADANGVRQESGFTAFQTDLAADGAWWLYPDVWFIENPTEVYDDEGSIIGFDRDNDGLPDLWEYRYELNLRGGWQDAWEDTDRDGLLDGDEYAYGTNPQLPDSDGDGFDDDAEMLNGGDPLDGTVVPTPPLTLEPVSGVHQYVGTGGSSAPLAVRVKQDGLPVAGAVVEFTTVSGGGTLRSNTSTATGTQVTVTTGSDGIASAVYLAGATPGSAVSIATLGGSGSQSVSFYLNILAGLGGTAAGGESVIRPWGGEAATQAPPPDADGDGIPDAWEIQHGLDPLVSNAGWDDDNDGFSDAEEYRLGSDMFDFNSRPGPSIEVRTKSYSGRYSKFTRDDGTGTMVTRFYGEAGLSDGETYLYVSDMNGSFPINDSPDRSQEMRTAFENGGYEALNPDSGYPYVFRGEWWQYVWSNAWSMGDPSGPLLSPWTKAVSGNAMELRLMPPTSVNAPAEDWSRTYLVVEYSGAWEDYPTFSSLPFKEVLGSLNFSHTANGTNSVTFSGEAAGQVKISGNDRVEIIPREEMGTMIRIALLPVEVDLAIPVDELEPPVIAATNDGWMVPPSRSSEFDFLDRAVMVPREKKATEGGWVVMNFDDDDDRGDYSNAKTNAISDLEYTGEIKKENDMIRVGIKKVAVGNSPVAYRFKFGGDNIRVWKKQNHTDAVNSEGTELTLSPGLSYVFAYIEGIKPHDDDNGTLITGQVKIGNGQWIDTESVKVRVAHPIVALYADNAEWSADQSILSQYLVSKVGNDQSRQRYVFTTRGNTLAEGYTFLVPGKNSGGENVCYSVTGVSGALSNKVFKLALKTDKIDIIATGHANYGIGLAFGANFTAYNDFFNMAGKGNTAMGHLGLENHPSFSVQYTQNLNHGLWNQSAIQGINDSRRSLPELRINRHLEGIPIQNVERFPHKDQVQTPPGQSFPEHDFDCGGVATLKWHFLEDQMITGGVSDQDASAHPIYNTIVNCGTHDVPAQLKYRSLVINSCNSLRNFAEAFKHGNVFLSWESVGSNLYSREYVKAIIEGENWDGVLDYLNVLDSPESPKNQGHGLYEKLPY